MDMVEDVLTYARDRYFKGEEVYSVIGNMWYVVTELKRFTAFSMMYNL